MNRLLHKKAVITVPAQGMGNSITRAFSEESATTELYIARLPMGRIGTSEEMASLAVYLASEESSYMTGQTIVIDGAMSL